MPAPGLTHNCHARESGHPTRCRESAAASHTPNQDSLDILQAAYDSFMRATWAHSSVTLK